LDPIFFLKKHDFKGTEMAFQNIIGKENLKFYEEPVHVGGAALSGVGLNHLLLLCLSKMIKTQHTM
jgi:hypothetical protein